jgi:hypothetical protein
MTEKINESVTDNTVNLPPSSWPTFRDLSTFTKSFVLNNPKFVRFKVS